MTSQTGRTSSLKVLVICALTLYLVSLVAPRILGQGDEGTRKIWDTAFLSTKEKDSAPARKAPRRKYRIATPNVPAVGVQPNTVIGVTLWRLHASRPADEGERILVHEENGEVSWRPERISADTKLSEGDIVRLSIEAARSGFLYVIDREQYADGKLGEPYLIFPTKRTRGGDNEVEIGRLIEIPAQDDDPPYFRLRRSRPDHVGELLVVLVTPKPIEGLEIGTRAIRLPHDTVAAWEKSWGGQVGRLEMEGGAAKSWTSEEKQAALDKRRPLSNLDPAPQTIYYSPDAKSNEPVLVKVQLHYEVNKEAGKGRRG